MELVGVRVELPSNTPIVLLRETEGQHRVLPIFIGGIKPLFEIIIGKLFAGLQRSFERRGGATGIP